MFVVVGLTIALQVGCAARPASPRTQSTAAAAFATAVSPGDPSQKLRGARDAAKRPGPPHREQAATSTVQGNATAPTESDDTAVGTSGGEVPLPTAGGEEVPPAPAGAAATPESSIPPPPAPAASGAASEAGNRLVRSRNLVIGLGFVATVLLLVFVLSAEHHRHE